jgi:hypothetical protein
LFLELLPLINAGQVSLLDHRRLIDQLLSLERRTSFGGGRDTVGHPPNAHDDIAVSVAGAAVLATARPGFAFVNGYRVGRDGLMIGHPNPALRSTDGETRPRFVRVSEAEAEAR